VSKDAPCRESMDDLLFNYADEYLQDVNIYLRKVEEAIKINREMYSKTVNIIKKSRIKILWNKGNNKDDRNQLRKIQKDAMSRIIDARKQISVISKAYNVLIKKNAKSRGFDNPTMKQAMNRFDWTQWKEAIDKEYQQLFEEGVFEECLSEQVPRNAKVIGSMMVLTIKRDPTKSGQIDKYKARLVALGNQQHESTYDDIKSGTARSASVKLLIALQAILGSYSVVMDVKGAYLKSKVKEDKQLYMRLPDKRIVKLKKYLYGLKQAGYEWQQNITSCLIQLGYRRSTTDELVFSKWWDNGDYMIM